MTNEVAGLFLEFSDRKLGEMTKKLTTCLDRLNDEQVWARGGPHENAVGNLVLHLCGNMRQWILHGVGGKPDVRTRRCRVLRGWRNGTGGAGGSVYYDHG